MVFTSPSVLWALSLIAIPIAIHLFQFRRYKQLYFSDISLLKEVKTTSQTKNQIKHLLILLSRILFVVLIVLAFADPVIPAKDDQSSADIVSFYVDNSFSMQSSTGSGNLLQHATQAAFDIASSYPKGTQFQLITNSFSANEKRFLDKESLIQRLDEVDVVPFQRTLSEVVDFQNQTLQGERLKRNTFLISDFNQFIDSLPFYADSLNRFSMVIMEAISPQNISVDTAWLETPISQKDAEQILHFSIVNHTDLQVSNLAIEVNVDGKRVAGPVLTLNARQRKDTSITFIPERVGFLLGTISIEDYPVTFDNRYHFVVPVSKSIAVVEVFGEALTTPTPFSALYNSEKFAYTSFDERALRLASFDQASLVILNGITALGTGLEAICRDRLEEGANVVIVLPSEMNSELAESISTAFGLSYDRLDTLTLEVNEVNTDHYLFQNVFETPLKQIGFPVARKHYKLNRSSYDESILTLFNRDPLLAVKRQGNGNIFIITSPLDRASTNLHRHALFVPAMINMAAYAGVGKPIGYPIGTQTIRTSHRTEEAMLSAVEDSMSFMPGLSYQGIVLGEQMIKPGHYHYRANDSIVDAFAFNYSRSESNIAPPSPEEIDDLLAVRGIQARLFEPENDDLSQDVAEANVGTRLWTIFVLIALGVLILETILLKRSTP